MYLKYILKRHLRKIKHLVEGYLCSQRIPAPYYRKWKILCSIFHNGSLTIETGTYLGETTSHLHAKIGPIISIEPYTSLAQYNKKRFRKIKDIEIKGQSSQKVLSQILDKKSGIINFWLDGHFSGVGTFGKIETASPIIHELEDIKKWLKKNKNNKAIIAVDDARLFNGKNGYPQISDVKTFAGDINYHFSIVEDIIVIRSNED